MQEWLFKQTYQLFRPGINFRALPEYILIRSFGRKKLGGSYSILKKKGGVSDVLFFKNVIETLLKYKT